jgi:pimeloyl-ACP methyl ester carboxylesterase
MRIVPALWSVFALLVTAPGAHASPYRFAQHPCAAELTGATCGSISVPEDYEHPSRSIALNVIVFRASEPNREKAAQFDLEGGPGFAVTDSAGFYASDGAAYRKLRDVVLFDMRGTGGSGALRCTGIEERQRAQPAAAFYPPELVADCAKALEARADLRQYTTAIAARDIDSVRETLGYARVDLNAVSYGTTLALRYIADYPRRVRSAVLTGTVSADRTPPAHHAAAAERGLQLLIAACRDDSDCAARYPDLWKDVDAAIERLGPEVGAVFMEKIRTQMYLPATARKVPALLHEAAGGNVAILAGTGTDRVFADGLYLAITCAESLGRIDVDEAIAEAAGTHFGAYRITRQHDACTRWPVGASDPKLFAKARRQVPVLFLSGALDPVTPPDWTAALAQMFPNSRHVVFPEGAHVLEGLSGLDTCMDAMILRFVASLSPQTLDTTCVAGMHREPFVPSADIQG